MLRDRLLGHTPLLYTVVAWGILISLWPAPALGAPVPAQLSQDSNLERDMETLRRVLEVRAVRTRLEALSLTPEEVEAKLSQLSPDELHQLAQRAEELQAGGQAPVPSEGAAIAILVLLALLVAGFIALIVWGVSKLISSSSPSEAPTPPPLSE